MSNADQLVDYRESDAPGCLEPADSRWAKTCARVRLWAVPHRANLLAAVASLLLIAGYGLEVCSLGSDTPGLDTAGLWCASMILKILGLAIIILGPGHSTPRTSLSATRNTR